MANKKDNKKNNIPRRRSAKEHCCISPQVEVYGNIPMRWTDKIGSNAKDCKKPWIPQRKS